MVAMRRKELSLVQENHTTVKLEWLFMEWKLIVKAEFKCKFNANSQLLKKMLEKSGQIVSSEQPCEPKDVVLNTEGVERI